MSDVTIYGVPGTMLPTREWLGSKLFSAQTWTAWRVRGTDSLTVTLRFDDGCFNGYMNFSITAVLRERRRETIGGSCHELITEWFLELAPLIKWHLCAINGPMHYVANTVYHAGAGEFAHARRSAVWPDATDAQLRADKETLTAALRARLPALLAEFRAAMVDVCGFEWRDAK
jgi:hypothetical protein